MDNQEHLNSSTNFQLTAQIRRRAECINPEDKTLHEYPLG